MAPLWLTFYQFLVLYIEKSPFLEILCYGSEEVGFQTRVILDLWVMVFHAMVAFGLGLDFLLKSIWPCCEPAIKLRKIYFLSVYLQAILSQTFLSLNVWTFGFYFDRFNSICHITPKQLFQYFMVSMCLKIDWFNLAMLSVSLHT